jgi:hypothetical protein
MKYIYLLFYLFFLMSCKSSQVKNNYKNSFIEMEKTPCYGWCPVYKISVSGEGKAVYEGKRNVDKLGKFEKQLSVEETKHLFDAFEASNFTDFKSEYTDQVTDLPTTYLTFSHRGFSKKIKDYYNAPSELKKLEKLVEEVANLEGWTEVVEKRD